MSFVASPTEPGPSAGSEPRGGKGILAVDMNNFQVNIVDVVQGVVSNPTFLVAVVIILISRWIANSRG
jgi:hypothetical protein